MRTRTNPLDLGRPRLRTTRALLRLAVASALMAGTLLSLGPAAMASAPAPCNVKNTTTLATYEGTGSNLQAAIDAAASGATLLVKGVCVGDFSISQDLSLAGATSPVYPDRATLDGGGALGTVLTVNVVVVELRDLKITNGASGSRGGGIYNAGSLTLQDSLVIANVAQTSGGGVFNVGSLTLTDTVVRRNTAGDDHCNFSYDCRGGGILNRGTLAVTGASSVRVNTAVNYGGGIRNVGTLTIDGSSSVDGNAAQKGGGIDNGSPGTLTLSGTSSVNGNTADLYGGGINNDATLNLSGSSSVAGNSAGSSGGGIWNGGLLTLDESSSVTANVAYVCGHNCGRGGGIFNFYGATLALNDSSSVSGNTSRQAAGIYNDSTADLTLNGSSSVSGNSANGKAGGILNANIGTVTMNDSSSVTGNTADADDSGRGAGGGIVNVCQATLNNAIDGGNVNDNYRGTAAPVEDNISRQHPCAGSP